MPNVLEVLEELLLLEHLEHIEHLEHLHETFLVVRRRQSIRMNCPSVIVFVK